MGRAIGLTPGCRRCPTHIRRPHNLCRQGIQRPGDNARRTTGNRRQTRPDCLRRVSGRRAFIRSVYLDGLGQDRKPLGGQTGTNLGIALHSPEDRQPTGGVDFRI